MELIIQYIDQILPGQGAEKAGFLIVFTLLILLLNYILKNVKNAETLQVDKRQNVIQTVGKILMTLEPFAEESLEALDAETKKELIQDFSELLKNLEKERVEFYLSWQNMPVQELKKALREKCLFLAGGNNDIVISHKKASYIVEFAVHREASGINSIIKVGAYFLYVCVVFLVFVRVYSLVLLNNVNIIIVAGLLGYIGFMTGLVLFLFDVIKQGHPQLNKKQWVLDISNILIAGALFVSFEKGLLSSIVFFAVACIHSVLIIFALPKLHERLRSS